jgi:predicted enzyme related to lactoylglutathione lyase
MFFCLVPFQFLTCLCCRQEWDGWAYPFTSYDSLQSNSEVIRFNCDTAWKLTNSVNWVEIPLLNFERAKEFYSKIYEYKMYEEMISGLRMGFLPMERESTGVGGAIVQGNGYIPSKFGSKIFLNGGENLQKKMELEGK